LEASDVTFDYIRSKEKAEWKAEEKAEEIAESMANPQHPEGSVQWP
jgi:hypothetical protein